MNDPRNPNDYTVKEILTEFVLPELRGQNKRIEKLEAFTDNVKGIGKVFGGLVAVALVVATLIAPALGAHI